MKGSVGASIVSIITESLYDKPIVVFREYIQNAADALCQASCSADDGDLSAHIWSVGNDLLFLDNGTGIPSASFENTMVVIANSEKRKPRNIGYKGIGRLSGLPYCKKLVFVNIVDYANRVFQEFDIQSDKYTEIRNSEAYSDLDFDALMSQIGASVEDPSVDDIVNAIGNNDNMFEHRNTGFLVVLKEITPVLQTVIEDEQFLDNLGWLLPVPFKPEIAKPSENDNRDHELFAELSIPNSSMHGSPTPAKSFCISYNGEHIYRPITRDMLRTYLCQSNLDRYAICVHTFSNQRIELNRKNPFSGIRIYIDNMLLCDENELLPALQQYGLTRHGTYELIQSVRGIGAMIYIVDKVNISANARRTFIDVTDQDSINFLTLMGEFVDSIYQARYALSGYNVAKRKESIDGEKLSVLRERALNSLEALARSEITLEVEDVDNQESIDFQSLSPTEQKRIVKGIITGKFSDYIKKYLAQTDEYNPETCFSDFKTWFTAN